MTAVVLDKAATSETVRRGNYNIEARSMSRDAGAATNPPVALFICTGPDDYVIAARGPEGLFHRGHRAVRQRRPGHRGRRRLCRRQMDSRPAVERRRNPGVEGTALWRGQLHPPARQTLPLSLRAKAGGPVWENGMRQESLMEMVKPDRPGRPYLIWVISGETFGTAATGGRLSRKRPSRSLITLAAARFKPSNPPLTAPHARRWRN